ncbi:MAG: hypothetical protein Ta2A_20620 [Treponemataceae bacterium]|nr:MAG: hypothetical protein Ta2A_20620 [Treponemataceae bacterium]
MIVSQAARVVRPRVCCANSGLVVAQEYLTAALARVQCVALAGHGYRIGLWLARAGSALLLATLCVASQFPRGGWWGCIITIDAMGCQYKIANKIEKGNQKQCYKQD